MAVGYPGTSKLVLNWKPGAGEVREQERAFWVVGGAGGMTLRRGRRTESWVLSGKLGGPGWHREPVRAAGVFQESDQAGGTGEFWSRRQDLLANHS